MSAPLAFGVATAVGLMRVVELRLAAVDACAAGPRCGAGAPDFLPAVSQEVRLLTQIEADGLSLLLSITLVFLALLVAVVAVNLATLILARGSGRRQEVALRSALGAEPWRLTRTVLGEALALALPAVAAGVALGILGGSLLDSAWPPGPGLTASAHAGLAHRLVPAVLAAVVLVAWLAPMRVAWSRDLRRWMAEQGSGMVGPMGTAGRDFLVVTQVAASLLLLATAGILLRGYALRGPAEEAVIFDSDASYIAEVRIGGDEGTTRAGRTAAYERILERVRALPEVVDTSLATEGAWLGVGVQDRVTALCEECYLGTDPKQISSGLATIHAVGPDYFAASDIPMLAGREFSNGDRPGADPVAIVSRTFAYRFFPNGEPLGKEIRLGGLDGHWIRVVGLAEEVVVPSLASAGTPTPAIYLALLQHPPSAAALLARGDPEGIRPGGLVAAVAGTTGDGALLRGVTTLDRAVDSALEPLRWFAVLLGGISAVMLLFAAGGLHQLMSYTVALRTREIGLRMALGADRASVVAMMMLRSLRLVAWGLVVGMIPLVGVARLLQMRLAGADPWDPVLTAAISAVLGGVALLASLGAAQRVAALEPQAALRDT